MENEIPNLSDFFVYDEKAPSCLVWRHNGKNAGSINGSSYWLVQLNKKCLRVHRVIWILLHGKTQVQQLEIDHIDGNPLNNEANNLRLCNRSQNACNRGAHKNNKLGIKGIHFCAMNNAYVAKIKKNGKYVFKKYYKDLEEAKTAIAEARILHHGLFSSDRI